MLLPLQVDAQRLNIFAEDDHPFQYLDKNNNIAGFSVEVVKEIQKRVGNNDIIQIVPWSRGLYKLGSEKNILLFSMAKTLDRESKYQWIGPIATVTYSIYVKKDSPIKITNLEDAKKLGLIGVYRGDYMDQMLSKENFRNLDRASLNVSNFKKLMIDRIDAYVDSPFGVPNVALKAGYSAEDVRLEYKITSAHLYIALSKKSDPKIVSMWNKALLEMKKDKYFLKIQKKYNINFDTNN